jgi:uncharacterized protein
MRRPSTARTRAGTAGGTAVTVAAVAAVLALLAFAAWLGVGFVAADRLTRPERRFDASQHPGTYGAVYRDVTLTTRDGLTIAAWHLPSPRAGDAGAGDARAGPVVGGAGVVLVHGHESSRTWEFYQSFPALAAALQANGYRVVMIDLRGHGESGGERFSFGHLERYDVMAAVDLLVAEGVPPGRVGVLGVSMGAATAIGAAADDPRIGALWADSGYADIRPIIEARWPGASGLPTVFLHAALVAHRLRFGFDLGGVRPEQEIARLPPRPIQLVHGTADTTVPYEHARRLAAASGAGLWTLPGVAHAAIYPGNPDAYTARVIDFFDLALRTDLAQAGR